MLRCIAIDDEPWALALVVDYIKKVPFLELTLASSSAIEALQNVHSGNIDLVFLDIQMPEINGIQFMKIINNKCRVILTTAYSEYALEGYYHNVVDYLLKPISFDRFYIACLKARDVLLPPAANMPIQEKNTPVPNTLEYIFIKTDSKIVRLLLNDILLIEGLKDYITIHTLNKKFIALENLKTFEDRLPSSNFIRVHKSYIVSIEKIDSIERMRISIGEQLIPIGDTYKEDFFNSIADRKFG